MVYGIYTIRQVDYVVCKLALLDDIYLDQQEQILVIVGSL